MRTSLRPVAPPGGGARGEQSRRAPGECLPRAPHPLLPCLCRTRGVRAAAMSAELEASEGLDEPERRISGAPEEENHTR